MDKKTSGKKNWLTSGAFYGVAFALLIAIAGVTTAIYDFTNDRNIVPESGETNQFSESSTSRTTEDFQANANATGIPDERKTTAEVQEKKSAVSDSNKPYSGSYFLPVDNKISKDFSNGNPVFSETMGDWRTHDGIDITAKIGDTVTAIQDGKITDIYPDELWGSVMIIEHGNGLTAKYCGVQTAMVSNTNIDKGQVIGTVVEIPVEADEESHVHLETEVNGEVVDPVKALNLLSENESISE